MSRNGYVECTPAVREVLWWSLRYPLVRSTALQEIIDAPARTVRYAVEKLMAGRYLEMSRVQKEQSRHFTEGYILQITDAGRSFYYDHGGDLVLPATNLSSPKKNFSHDMGLIDTRMSIDYGARLLGMPILSLPEIVDRFEVGFTPTRELRTVLDLPSQFPYRTSVIEEAVRADDLVALRHPTLDRSMNVFIEYERTTPGERSDRSLSSALKRKIEKYEYVAEHKIFRQRFPFMRGFSVLFVYTSPGRMAEPMKIVERHLGDEHTIGRDGQKRFNAERYLFTYIDADKHFLSTVRPRPEIVTGELHRGGLPPTTFLQILES